MKGRKVSESRPAAPKRLTRLRHRPPRRSRSRDWFLSDIFVSLPVHFFPAALAGLVLFFLRIFVSLIVATSLLSSHPLFPRSFLTFHTIVETEVWN